MNDKTAVSAVIPAYNESEHIYHTVSALRGIDQVDEIIVVDDASLDETTVNAKRAGAKVIKLSQNEGKGGALTRGVQEASGNVLLLLDGDLGESARYAEELLLPVVDKKVDMTVAKFPRSNKKAGFGLVKGLARAGIRYFAGIEVEAPLSGQRAITRRVADDIIPFASGYGVEVGLTIRVARLGYKILEVPVAMTHAETGRDWAGFKHRGKQFVHVAKELFLCFFKKYQKV